MDLSNAFRSCGRLVCHLYVLHGKEFNVGHYIQPFLTFFFFFFFHFPFQFFLNFQFLHALLTSSILYHFS